MRARAALIVLALLLFPGASRGDNFGASYLAMCSRFWPCEESLDALRGSSVRRVGWLARTFGSECGCPRKFLALPGPKAVRVHLANGTCFPERGRRCMRGELFHGETIRSAERKVRHRAPGILRRFRRNLENVKKTLALADRETEILLSPCLECPLSSAAREVLFGEARAAFPTLPPPSFVDNPLQGPCLPETTCEVHGAAAKCPREGRCVIDTDGDDILKVEPRAFMRTARRADIAFLWTPGFNLLDRDKRGFQPPGRRKTTPSAAEFLVLWFFMTSGR